VLVEYRTTSEGGYVFLAGPEDDGIRLEQLVEIPTLTSRSVRAELIECLQAQYTDAETWPAYLDES
jgi:hypothetical protein